MTIQSYLETLNLRYKTGISREHTYRGDLQSLLMALLPDILVTNEPSRVACDAPDYVLTRKDVPVGYIEAKDSGIDLQSKTLKEQFDIAMLEAYWKIGQRIVLQEQDGSERAGYGEGILKELSIALTSEFGKGFSFPNLYNMRQFYMTYQDYEIFYTLCIKLTWSHNRLIMRVNDTNARAFYLKEVSAEN